MKELTVEESNKVALDILLTIADFCDKHNLRYYLTYGTLIGAVRHNGFIPWDDDIDITMPREDYNAFLKLFNEEMKDAQYRVIAPYDKQSKHPFAKVTDTRTVKREEGLYYDVTDGVELGVDVDIFPLDGTPTDDAEYDAWYKKLYRVYFRLLCKTWDVRGGGSLVRKLKIVVGKCMYGTMFTTKNALLNKAAKLHAEYPYEKCEYVGSIESAFNGKGNRVRKEYFDDFVMVSFEGYSFKAPKGYHEVLTSIYGDYMQLPPEEKRVTHHANKIYMKK